MAKVQVGGEVDGFCTKCRMVLAHTVLAVMGATPARVQCNTCGGQHNYRKAPEAAGPKVVRASSAEARTEKARVSFEEAIASKSGAGRDYSPKAAFRSDEVVLHPSFGRGYVSAVRGDKVDIVFASGMRTLVHARG